MLAETRKVPGETPKGGGLLQSQGHKKRGRTLSGAVFRYQARFSSTINPKQLSRNNVCATFSWSVACSDTVVLLRGIGDLFFVPLVVVVVVIALSFYLWSESLQDILFWVKKNK